MQKTMISRAVTLAVLMSVAFLYALPHSLFAQESVDTSEVSSPSYIYDTVPNAEDVIGDFVVGPGKAELSVAPRTSKTIDITITNRTGVTRDFIFSVEDVSGSRDGSSAVILLGEDRGPYTLKDYIQIPTEPITLKQGQRVKVPITITVPLDAEPGGRYGSVLVETVSQKIEETETMAARSPLVARIGTLFFLTIPGDAKTEGSLQEFTTVPKSHIFNSGPIDFSLLYENTGSVHINPYGEIRITNMLGEEVGFVELEPWFALPDSLRLREVTWNRDFLVGRYTATAHINRGYDDIIDTMEISFWVIPWKLAGVTFGIIFIILYTIRTFFKRFEFKRKD